VNYLIGIAILIITIPVSLFSQQQILFDKYFTDKTMRIDYYHIGDAKSEFITIDQIYQYGIWAGSRQNLIDHFNNGSYYAKIYDVKSGNLIYSKGFDSYFREYKSTNAAINGERRTYHETILFPSPNSKVVFRLERRDDMNQLYQFYSDTLDPTSVNVIRHEFVDPGVEVFKVRENGDPHGKVDVVILSEGYANTDKDKFKSDVDRVANVFFKQEPFKSSEHNFNLYAVFKASTVSGISEPRAGIYKQTALSATFNSLNSERYVLTEDNKSMRDMAAHVPYDAIYIMVNHHRYGGGGIYNLFCTFMADNQSLEYLLIHEFGHSFAGLADEYYGSPVAYNDLIPQGLEPLEPNITSLSDSKNIKWNKFLSEEIEIPTPWKKEDYDNTNFSWQELRKKLNNKTSELKREGAPAEEISAAETDYNQRQNEANKNLDQIIQSDPSRHYIGAFEGAGYSATGLYRPMIDCIMFSIGDKPFCKVCENAINQVINHYLEK
jgi:hypothetical protein